MTGEPNHSANRPSLLARVLFAVCCALVVAIYFWRAESGLLESWEGDARDTYYNLLVQGFQAGQPNLKLDAPVGLGQLTDPYDPNANAPFRWGKPPLHDLSFYRGKLYLYHGITPAVLLYWPYAAITGHYLLNKFAVAIFFSIGFLAGAAILWKIWHQYFPKISIEIILVATIALGFVNFAPAILTWCDIHEVAISCGYAMTMLALAALWRALHDPRRSALWLALASLAYGLAVAARPSLLPGAILLLLPAFAAWRAKMRVASTLLAAIAPMLFIGIGLAVYNGLRFGNPLEFGQRYQLSSYQQEAMQQFSPDYLWFNFRVAFLNFSQWNGHFPFVRDAAEAPLPEGYFEVVHPFGILTNTPFALLAFAGALIWQRNAPASRPLKTFLIALILLFATLAFTLLLHNSMCLRYQVEFASPLALLAIIGVLAIENHFTGRRNWMLAARCGWVLLAAFSVTFVLLVSFRLKATAHYDIGTAFLQGERTNEAIAQYRRALEIDPRLPDVLNNLGNALFRTGNPDEAIPIYRRALQLEPDSYGTLNNLGAALLKTGQPDEALQTFQRVVQLKPDDPRGWFILGRALASQGRFDEARRSFEEALRLKPEFTEAQQLLRALNKP